MEYIEVSQPGDPRVMRLCRGDRPQPKPGELLIRVAAAGVNRADILQRQGHYPPPSNASPVLGLEVSGHVAACGDGVDGWRVDEPVCALVNGGAYAQFVTVPAGQCLPIPGGVSLREAAALPEACFTVWTNVFERGALQPGESLLVHGGSGGIGTTAIQLARARGARVFATAGNDEKCRACQSLGAELAVNYRTSDFVARLLDATQSRGVDVILDMVGGDYVPRNIKVAAEEGRIVQIACVRGAKVELNLLPLMMKRLVLTGSTLRPLSDQAKATIANQIRQHVWPLIESGHVRPQIFRTFPLAEAAAAHELMEQSAHIGKIVLTVADG